MKSRVSWAFAGLACLSACTQSLESGSVGNPAIAAKANNRPSAGERLTEAPKVTNFTDAPLHNRVQIELFATASDVWSLVGDISRLPEYSSGLEEVEVNPNDGTVPREYICHFKPSESGSEGFVHRELVRWYEPNIGFASVAEEPNVFGLSKTLSLITLRSTPGGTTVTWEQYYYASDLEMNKAAFDQALTDIATRLVERFGGRIVERRVE